MTPQRLLRAGGWVRVALIVSVFAVVGALAGVLWQAIWTPPAGVAFKGEWFLDPSGPDVAVAGTALYVVIAVVTGIVLGVGAAALPRRESAVLIGVIVGSSLAGLVMYLVGHALGPADPHQLAAGQPDFTAIPSDLEVATPSESGGPFTATALLGMPAGALTGLAVVYLLGRHPSETVAEHHYADGHE